MNKEKILELLRNTTNPDAAIREPAEANLSAIHKIIGFTPALLELVLDQQIELHIRQAAVIYLKNNVIAYWESSQQFTESGQSEPVQYVIHDHDKKILRDTIVDAIISCGQDRLAIHLSSLVNCVIKADFPNSWPGVVKKIHYYLAETNDPNAWQGALMAFYQLAKVYEYRNANERKPFIQALSIIMPASCQRLTQLIQNDPLSEQSCRLQKIILKSFHATIQYSLPQTVLTTEVFSQWMTLIVEIAKRDVPDAVQKDVDSDDRPNLIWWKCKKWAFHLLVRIFERYGSPKSVKKEYKSFAEWYIQTFSLAVIQTLIKTLEQYALGQYVSPRVLQQALNYVNAAVLHSVTWKLLKNDMMVVVEKIIFPLMCHSDDDEELWQTDPREYIRMKFDIFEEYVSPVSASQNLIHTLCKKRRDMLQKIMTFVVTVLNDPQKDARAKDGALHMIGSISKVLVKKPVFKDELEQMLLTFVYPLFGCNQGFLRARACWVLNSFSAIEFKSKENVALLTQAVLQSTLRDHELPVKVEAALCLQSLLHVQDLSREVTQPMVKELGLELVQIIRSTESEDVMEVFQKIVYLYPDDLYTVAVDMTKHLAGTFLQLIQSGENDEEEKISAAMAILSTIDTILTMLDEQKEVVTKLEPIVVEVVMIIFDKMITELYEEATTLLSTITSDAVSAESWRVFQTLYVVSKRHGPNYFSDLMSPIHNYITVDPQTFVSSRDNVAAIFDMCQSVLTDQTISEELESYAAKLVEIVILQFRNQIDDCIPSFVELAITRLRRDTCTAELRTLLLQIVIAAFYHNYQLLLDIFEKMEQQTNQPKYSLFDSFIKQWLKDLKELLGLHDRKMSVIGFCTLIALPADKRPPIVLSISNEIVPHVLNLYERLKIAYEKKTVLDSSSETDDDEEEDDDSENEAEVLDDDQDHALKYTASDDDEFEDIIPLDEGGENQSETDEYDEYESDDDCEPTALESFETLIDTPKGFVDEFILFRDTMESIRQSDVNWYHMLLAPLDVNQQKKLMEFGEYCNNRKTATGPVPTTTNTTQ